jgi:5-methylcytosine-specific restriction protein A
VPWSRTSRHDRGYGHQWNKLRQQVLKRDKHLCQPCLRASALSPATQVDHIIPKAKGGTDDLENLEGICSPCHKRKTTLENGGRPKVAIGLDGWPV